MSFLLYFFKVFFTGSISFILLSIVMGIAIPTSPYWALSISAMLTALVVSSATYKTPTAKALL